MVMQFQWLRHLPNNLVYDRGVSACAGLLKCTASHAKKKKSEAQASTHRALVKSSCELAFRENEHENGECEILQDEASFIVCIHCVK